jgi:hypothetical protein
MRDERFEVTVTFDERRGYVASAPKPALARDGVELERSAPQDRGRAAARRG